MSSPRYAREKCARLPLWCLTPKVRNASTPPTTVFIDSVQKAHTKAALRHDMILDIDSISNLK